MTQLDVARLIPDKFRRQLLEANAVYKAVAAAGDSHMGMLIIIWRNYINPGMQPIDMTNPCLRCLTDILDKFKILEPYLIDLEKQFQLLEA